MATSETMELSAALKAAFDSDMRQLAEGRNVSLSDAQLDTAFTQFCENNSELISRHGADGLALVSLPSRQKMTTSPSGDRFKGWQVLESGERKVHTNGYLVDFSGAEPHQQSWETYKAEKNTITLEKLDGIYKGQSWIDARVGFDARVAIPAQQRSESILNEGYLAFTIPDAKDALLVNEDYLAFFASKIKEPVFQINEAKNMMRVLDDASNMVGMIALTKHPHILTAAADLEQLTHSKVAIFNNIVERSFEEEAQVAAEIIAAAQEANAPKTAQEEPEHWRKAVSETANESGVEGTLGAFTPAPAFAGSGAKVAAGEKLADVLGAAAAREALANAAEASHGESSLEGDESGLPADYGMDAATQEPEETQSQAAPAPEPGVEAVSPTPESAADAGEPSSTPQQEPGAEAAQTPVKPLDMLAEAQAAAKLPAGVNQSPGAEGKEFELGQPIAASYAPAEHYQEMLKRRISSAVSLDHAAAMIRQECEALGHSKMIADQQAQYFRDTLSDLSHERDVDALAYCLGRMFNRAFYVWRMPVDERRNIRGQVDKTLEQLDLTLSADQMKERSPNSQKDVTSGGSVGEFRRNSAFTGLKDLEASIDPQGELDTAIKKSQEPMEAPSPSPEDRFKADVPYMATRATAMFKAMQPEHLISDQQKLDQRWIDKVTEKLDTLKGKLSNSSLADTIKDGIQAILENLGTIFTSLVEMAKKLLSGDKENDKPNENGVVNDGAGRIEPSFASVER